MKTKNEVKPTHTPGPWKVIEYGSTGLDGVPRLNGYRIELTDGTKFPTGKNEANARLIAASPDLLSALQGLVSAFCPPDDTTSEHWVKARAAIAKAQEGR